MAKKKREENSRDEKKGRKSAQPYSTKEITFD